jgi:hypothetical protein
MNVSSQLLESASWDVHLFPAQNMTTRRTVAQDSKCRPDALSDTALFTCSKRDVSYYVKYGHVRDKITYTINKIFEKIK